MFCLRQARNCDLSVRAYCKRQRSQAPNLAFTALPTLYPFVRNSLRWLPRVQCYHANKCARRSSPPSRPYATHRPPGSAAICAAAAQILDTRLLTRAPATQRNCVPLAVG
jgi:hypothetical protein